MLANKFILVSNLIADDGGKAIIEGNERVIRARLSDAKFFWDQDRKVKLEDRLPALKDIIFHEELGTQAERVERLQTLAGELANIVGADQNKAARAAELCKADLVTDMVGEFPDLQGLMGRYYALDQGEDASVVEAIEEHYRPQGPNEAVPNNPVSIAVALADKLDTLVGFWAIDEKPTGSKDPYALRRAALGVIRIVLENAIRIETQSVAWEARSAQLVIEAKRHESELRREFLEENESTRRHLADLHALEGGSEDFIHLFEFLELADTFDKLPKVEQRKIQKYVDSFMDRWWHVENQSAWLTASEVVEFFHDRLKVYLRDRGARHDLIDAVISDDSDDLLMIVARVEALSKFLETDDGANLLAGVKRAQNILRIEEKKDSKTYNGAPDEKLLKDVEEKALAKAIDEATKAAEAAAAKEDFEGAMAAMAKLRNPVDAFFDHVTVNADDPALRENRLKLLNQIREATLAVADFSKIEG